MGQFKKRFRMLLGKMLIQLKNEVLKDEIYNLSVDYNNKGL